MFTTLRSRLWLSYALVITIALSIVAIVLLAFLINNPTLSRDVQQRLRTAQTAIVDNSQQHINDPSSLAVVGTTYNVRILVYNARRDLVLDTQPTAPQLPFPRRNILARNAQVELDAKGIAWLYTSKKLANGGQLVVAALRPPKAPVLGIFADQFLLPVLEGGLIALLLSLILAFVIARSVADPLQQIVIAARKYPEESDAMKTIQPRGPHEVQDLTRAFNSMIVRVENTQQSQRDFVANVSHELKTPLTSIQGFAQALLDETADTPEARKQAAQIIYDESGRMHRMALDLLDLARLEAGTADLKMSAVDIGALLRGIAEKFMPQAQKAGVNLQVELPNDLPALIGDGDRLAQVFTNLVDNALKFTPVNGRITLSAEKAGAKMKLIVTDTGKGVASEALPRLFDRFYQADSSRAERGAGLGLAIVQEIVQAHDGKIGVRSQVGHGTTFTIHLPLTKK